MYASSLSAIKVWSLMCIVMLPFSFNQQSAFFMENYDSYEFDLECMMIYYLSYFQKHVWTLAL